MNVQRNANYKHFIKARIAPLYTSLRWYYYQKYDHKCDCRLTINSQKKPAEAGWFNESSLL